MSARATRRIGFAWMTAMGVAGLVGCAGGHGAHTSEALARAQERLGALKAGTEWEMASQQHLAGDLDKALKSVDKAIGLSPSVARSHTLRGRILLEMGRLEAAKESLERALAIDPAYTDAHYYLGVIHERFSEPAKALENFARAAELDASNAQYVVAAAETMIDLDRLGEAERYLDDRRASFQHNAGVRQTLGHIASLGGEWDRAAGLFNEARLLAPDDLEVLEDLARAQFECGRHDEAEHALSRLLADPKRAERRDLIHLRARCLMGMDRMTQARDTLLGLTGGTKGAADAAAWRSLGEAALALGDSSRVRLAAKRLAALEPSGTTGPLLLATDCRRRGDHAGSLAAVDGALSRTPNDLDALLFRAVVLRELSREGEARDALVAALRVAPADARARRLLADADVQE